MKRIITSSKAAIDLASIMVGIIVIGLIGAVIAATIFLVIPWAQDNAAKQQLDNIKVAQDAAKALASDPSNTRPDGQEANQYADSDGLAAYGLMTPSDGDPAAYCTQKTRGGEGYISWSASASGKAFYSTDENPQAEQFYGTDWRNCLGPIVGGQVGYEQPDPTQYETTSFTLNCPTTITNFYLPFQGTANGTAQWNDGTTHNYRFGGSTPKTLTANTDYKVDFTGTFTRIGTDSSQHNADTLACFRSMDSWANNADTTNASRAFQGMVNLTNVPASIPTTVTNLSYMFNGATNFNDSDIQTWDVKNVTTTEGMFQNATNFNQSVERLNTSNVTNMTSMFNGASRFNQALNGMDTYSVTSMNSMFRNAIRFNQPINSWNTSNVTNLNNMFYGATNFNQDLNNWNTQNVTNLHYVFYYATNFNGQINNWNTGNSTTTVSMFEGASAFNQPLNNWDMRKITITSYMFHNTTNFNQPLNNWKFEVLNATNQMFHNATNFNQNINNWNVSNVTTARYMFSGATNFNQPLNNWNVGKMETMENMFADAPRFNQNISNWDVKLVSEKQSYNAFNRNGIISPANLPKFTR